MTSISSKAMLVYLNITGWSGRKFDDKTSTEIAEKHGTTVRRAGNYNKCLIDQEARTWRQVKRAEDRVRKYHYEHTLKWSVNGAQMVTAAMFFEYAAQMQKLETSLRQAWAEFFTAYPSLKENARRELNGMYDESAYPSIDELKSRFTYGIDYYPLPTGDDMERLRDAIGVNAEIDAMAQNVEDRVEAAVQDAMRDVAKRVYEPVRSMASALAQDKKVFRDSLVENVRDIAALLPKLNVTGDPELDAISTEIKAKLTAAAPAALREDGDLRAQVAKDADEIARKMAAFMGRKA